MIVDITQVPSMASLKRSIYVNTEKLTERQLVNGYKKILAYLYAYSHKQSILPDHYFVGAVSHASSGFAPKDMWLFENTRYAKEEYAKEFEKRNLIDAYTFFVEL